MAEAVSYVSLYTTSDVRQKVAGLRSAALQTTLETLPAANPVQYGPGYAIPGTFSWGISGAHLQLFEEDVQGALTLEASQARLRDLHQTRAPLEVEVEYPGGSTETGTAIITGLKVEGAYDDILQGSFQLLGVGPLT